MDLTSVVEAIIGLAVAVLTVFVLPWISGKTTAREREDLLCWVDIAVAAAQQLFYGLNGAQRLEYALEVLEDEGFDVDSGAVRNAVEAAVLKLHRELEKGEVANDG